MGRPVTEYPRRCRAIGSLSAQACRSPHAWRIAPSPRLSPMGGRLDSQSGSAHEPLWGRCGLWSLRQWRTITRRSTDRHRHGGRTVRGGRPDGFAALLERMNDAMGHPFVRDCQCQELGWQYPLAEAASDASVHRCVVRSGQRYGISRHIQVFSLTSFNRHLCNRGADSMRPPRSTNVLSPVGVPKTLSNR
jgi:hypothetical protein